MMNIEGGKKRGVYEAALDTAIFMASEGNYELALRLTQKALESLSLEKETAEELSTGNDERLQDLETQLTKRYIEYRSKVEGKERPYWSAFIRTLIICCTISVSLIITIAIVIMQVKSLVTTPLESFLGGIHATIKAELPRLSNEVREQIPGIAQKIRDEIPKATKDLTRMSEVKVKQMVDERVEKSINEKLPAIIDEKIKKASAGSQEIIKKTSGTRK